MRLIILNFLYFIVDVTTDMDHLHVKKIISEFLLYT
jgi:hypothetical protein